MAFTGVAALVGAIGTETAITATMVLSAVAEVGTAMSVVGAVTGSKGLMKAGAVMGLVGGVGSFAAGMMSSTAAAGTAAVGASDALAPEAFDAAGAAGDFTGQFATEATHALGDTAGDFGGGVISSAISDGGPAVSTDLGPVGAATDAASSTALPSTAVLGDGTAAATAPVDTSVAGQTAAAQPLQGAPGVDTPAGIIGGATAPQAAPGAITNPTDFRLAAGTQTSPLAGAQLAPLDSQTFMQRVMSFATDPKNKTVMELGAKLAGGALQGIQQQKQFDTKVDLERQRIKQTSYGSQVGQNRPSGIIKGARA